MAEVSIEGTRQTGAERVTKSIARHFIQPSQLQALHYLMQH
ncbi:MAG TPA: hypothetical protein VKB84_12075 [Candidatus Binataceae bacterium]|jgi:hypothetical protein|nr:hypothetical protein [Candidatus Binataceae bacterium]